MTRTMGCALVLMRRAVPIGNAAAGGAANAAARAGADSEPAGSRPTWMVVGSRVSGCCDGPSRGAAAQPVLANQEAQMPAMQARNRSWEHAAAKRGKAEHRRAYSRSRALRSSLLRGSRQRRRQKSQLPAELWAIRALVSALQQAGFGFDNTLKGSGKSKVNMHGEVLKLASLMNVF